MADTVQTQSLIILQQSYVGNLIRQINRRSVLLSILGASGKIREGSGPNYGWAVENSGMIAENFTEGADAANFGSDAQAAATMSWGSYRANFHVSGQALRSSANAQTPAGNMALWARNMENAQMALASLINDDIFDGTGSGGQIVGLDTAIGSTSATYAGIDRSVGGNSYFRPYVVDPGASTAITMGQIRTDMAAIYEASGFVPNVAVCSPTLYNSIGALFDDTRRRNEDAYVQTAAGPVRLEGGIGAIQFDGMTFVRDKDATAGYVYYLNTDFVEVVHLPANIPAEAQAIVRQMQLQDGVAPVPLGIEAQYLAKNGDSDRASLVTNFALVVRRPNACGVRKNAA